MTTFNPAQTGNSRVFLIDGRARPDHQPLYQSSVKAGGISQGYGDIEKIEVPDPNNFDKFLEVGTIRGAKDRATVTLTGRYARDIKSELLKIANQECFVDVQINFGACTDPSAYNVFNKKIILQNATVTNWGSDDLGALESGERGQIDETLDISATDVYEIVQVAFGEKGGGVVTNEVVDVVTCDTASCGDCEEDSDGCSKVFAVTKTAGGSASTPADIVFTLNSGTTWYAHDVDTLTSADGDGIACLGDYVFVVSNGSGSAHYALKSEFDGTTDPSFTEISTGFVAGGEPNAVSTSSSYAYIAADGGYIYRTTDISAGVSEVESGTAHTAPYRAIHAFSDDYVVAVGTDGIIAKTENGTTWSAVTSPLGVGSHFNAVWMLSNSVWLLGTSTGVLYYTVNSGTSFTLKAFPGSGSGVVRDIVGSNDSVLYMAHDTTAPLGRILRSTNGGYDWVVTPEGSGTLPLNDRINALATCGGNADFVVGVGLGDDAADGYIVVGTD
jgi:photosystem II stability/assembly factor-like uncharacterized protein